VRPATSAESVIELMETEVEFSGGNLGTDFSNAISLAGNKVTNLGTNKLSLSINASSGLFSGSVVDPSSGKSLKFGGAILQKQNIGSGFLLGTSRSSHVALGE